MFVLGIDPGLSRCGYGIVEASAGSQGHRAVAAGVITTPPGEPVARRLLELQSEVEALLAEFDPRTVAIERVLFQANVRTAIAVGQASGIVMAEAARRGADVVEYSPNEIKLAVTGDGSADKSQMEAMVQLLLGIDRPLRPVDAADAVAVALCHLSVSPALVGRRR